MQSFRSKRPPKNLNPEVIRNWSQAMINAIESNCDPKYLKKNGDKLLFNGFWRGGDSTNVCMWIGSATWHDARTDAGGGCKEFAKIAFGLNLPEFINRYGTVKVKVDIPISNNLPVFTPKALIKSINQIWNELKEHDKNRPDLAGDWLLNSRGFEAPRSNLELNFANLSLEDVNIFEVQHRNFIAHRINLGSQLIAPLRAYQSGHVKNLFFRCIRECPKQEKSRLLPNVGGWHESDGTPRAFGFPHLLHDFPNLVLCEGMADYFAAECLLSGNEKYLPIGVSNSSSLKEWARWLVKIGYRGKVVFIYQLDVDKDGIISASAIGQASATEALKILLEGHVRGELFKWGRLLKNLPGLSKIPDDLAGLCSLINDKKLLQKLFFDTLAGDKNGHNIRSN